MTVLWYAKRKGIPVEDIQVVVERDDSRERQGVYRLRVALELGGPLSDMQRQELLARMRALMRRRPPRGSAALVVGDLRLNPDTREVNRGDRQIELTNREFELLEYLMRNERLVVSRERLLEEVWGYDPMAMTNTIDVFISNLRRKLEEGDEDRVLHTKRGAGYVLRAAR